MSSPTFESGDDFLRHVRETGGQATDGVRPPEWSEGWAVIPFGTTRGSRAHWYWRTHLTFTQRGHVWVAEWSALCGRAPRAVTFKARDGRELHALSPGNFARCSFCVTAVRARTKHALGLPIGRAFKEWDPR